MQRKGIETAAAFILFLTKGVLLRPFCQVHATALECVARLDFAHPQFEIRAALALKKPMVLLHGARDAYMQSPFDIRALSVPVTLQKVTQDSAVLISARPTRKRLKTWLISLIHTKVFRSGGEATSATG